VEPQIRGKNRLEVNPEMEWWDEELTNLIER
jgi:hypothetical protein